MTSSLPDHPVKQSNIAGWILTIIEALKKRHIDTQQLLQKAGINEQELSASHYRIPLEKVNQLWHEIRHCGVDEGFALELPNHIKPQALHGLSFALISSTTVHELMLRSSRFAAVASTATKLEFEQDEQHFVIVIQPSDQPRPAQENIDGFMALMVANLHYLINDPMITPVKITLTRAQPTLTGAFEKAFRCPIQFSAERDAIYYNKHVLALKNPHGNHDVANYNDRVLTQYLASFEQQSIAQQVRNLIVEQLSNGAPSQQHIANQLHISARSLQRRLQAESTQFKKLLDEVRYNLASEYLRDGHFSITEISFLVGFNDSSHFTRAFKRWSGQSPSEFLQT